MLNCICVQEDGTTSQFRCDTIYNEKTIPFVVWQYLTNFMVLL